jgi:invasion protein IalB
MLARIVATLLVVFAATLAADAQPRPLPLAPRPFPAEKFSNQPVQSPMIDAPARLSPAANPEQRPVVQSIWTKFCGKDTNNPHGQSVCLTVKEIRLGARAETFLAGVALIEAAGEDRKILRVTLPSDLQRSRPVRMHIDGDAVRSAEFRQCLPNGCAWDFPAEPAFVALLKSGERLHIAGVAASGEIASYDLPLAEFARANDGPPTDPASFDEYQKRRGEERSRRPAGQGR